MFTGTNGIVRSKRMRTKARERTHTNWWMVMSDFVDAIKVEAMHALDKREETLCERSKEQEEASYSY